jgi:nicotinamidase-related amidase
MTTEISRSNPEDYLLSPDNAALVIIDFQPLQVTSVASMDRRVLVQNISAVAKIAKLFDLPVVLTTVNVRSGFNKPMIHQLAEIFPDIDPIDRTTLNAWEDDAFRSAVEATGRKKLIMCAIWTEVCLAFPVLSAMRAGFDVFPVVDAVGGTSLVAHRAALDRMQQAGAQVTSWVQLICELQRDWAREETVPKFSEILFAVEGN